jgi:transcription elongation GreA/GreB family factor
MERGKDRAKFVELAEKRVCRAIKDIRLIGNLSNKSNYSYTEEDVRKITRALEAEVKKLKQRFESHGVADEVIFKL